MFSSITWGQYFTVISSLLICYYTLIGFRYYRWEILSLIGIKKVNDSGTTVQTISDFKKSFAAENHHDYSLKPALEVDISPLLQSFTDEVQAYLQQTANNKIEEEEFFNSIQLIASKYPVLKEADCKEELVQFILNETNTRYPNLLQRDDLIQLWN